MSDDAAGNRIFGTSPARVAGAALGLLALAICIWRIRYLHEPLENDLTIRMAYAARSAAGAQYYSDLFVFGPAGALWINEAFYRVFGMNELAVYVMGCAFSVLTLLGVYRCARLLTDVRGALIAAATWALISADLFTQANQPNAEVFINAALVWAFALVLDRRAQSSPWRLVAAGLLFFLASSIKHFIAVTPMLAAAAAVFLPTKGSSGWNAAPDRNALREWSVVAAVAVAAWALLLGWYAATGRLDTVLTSLLGSSVDYATQQRGFVDNFLAGFSPSGLLPAHQQPFVVLYAFLVAAVAGGLIRATDPRWRAVLGWTLGTALSVSFSGRFYPHYYMLWFPLLALGASGVFGLAQDFGRPRVAAALRAGIALVILAVGVRQVAQLVRYDAQEAARAKYGSYVGSVFTDVRHVGRWLAGALPAGASVFEIGAHGLYFHAARPAPVPFVDSIYGIDSAFPAQYRQKMLPALLESPPAVLVVRRSVLKSETDAALRQVLAELLNAVPYVEDKRPRSEVLMVLRRCRPDDRIAGRSGQAPGNDDAPCR